jgi:hypothetical protein
MLKSLQIFFLKKDGGYLWNFDTPPLWFLNPNGGMKLKKIIIKKKLKNRYTKLKVF